MCMETESCTDNTRITLSLRYADSREPCTTRYMAPLLQWGWSLPGETLLELKPAFLALASHFEGPNSV